MSVDDEHNYVSAVFFSLLQPIADLCDRMLARGSGQPNEVQTAPAENGYAISIIALTAFVLEGSCGRGRYISGQEQCSAVDTLRNLGNSDLAGRVEEIFVVRDAIAHAHLWSAKISSDLQFRESPVLLPGYGDRKFERLVDPDSRKTRQLKLDIFPNRIHRATAIVALKEAAKALEFLESKDRNFVYLQPRHVRSGDKFIPFYKWVRELPA
jgi:hypothetical protein